MEILNIEGADDTPKIVFDKKNGIFQISGRSLPEDSVDFYRPVLNWIADYAKEPNPSTEFVFKLEYANTASSKLLQDIIFALDKVKGMKIFWYYQTEDEDMEEAGREFSELVDTPFEFKAY
jgi:hypothetical protein